MCLSIGALTGCSDKPISGDKGKKFSSCVDDNYAYYARYS